MTETKDMKKNKNRDEVLIKFPDTSNTKELDDMIREFEKLINEFTGKYYLKESENPYIYFLEYTKPKELIENLEYREELSNINFIPVNCVINNINYITSTIHDKIRHKIKDNDTFDVTCYIDGYSALYSKEELEKLMKDTLKQTIHIDSSKNDPMWKISIYIIGDISAINISRSTRNRNKFSQYN